MKRVCAAAGLFLTLAAPLSAHRLDEYLQASRIDLARGRVTLEIDLTPGAAVANDVMAFVDRDGDNTITPLEAKAYAERVLADVVVELDGRAIAMTLVHVEAPPIDEMRHGMGTIQVRATGVVEAGSLWRRQRQLRFRNNHHARSSVYLVNAMIPTDSDVTVRGQARDTSQREARVDYGVSPEWPKYAYWPVVGLVVGGWWLVVVRSESKNLRTKNRNASEALSSQFLDLS